MECEKVEQVKPLDVLLDDQIREFESGQDVICDKELDRTMWELSYYQDDMPDSDVREFGGEYEENPIEEDLVEKKLVFGKDEKLSYMKDDTSEEDIPRGEDIVDVHSMSPDEGE